VRELRKPDAHSNTHIMISIAFSTHFGFDESEYGAKMCINQTCYTRDVQKPAILKSFTAIQPQMDQLNSMRRLTLMYASAQQASDNATGIRCAYMNLTVKADVATLQDGADAYIAAI
jgi:hypothetical protein